MERRLALRALGVGALFACFLLATELQLVAWSSIPNFCNSYDQSHDCSCSASTIGGWTASGWCDFSQEQDWETYANEFCISAFGACASDCESSEYQEWKADHECDVWNPGPECNPECWITWASANSCDAGTTSDFSCACTGVMICEPKPTT